MGKRDFVAEILSKKSRLNPNTDRWDIVSLRLNQLREAQSFIREVVPEIEEITRDMPELEEVNNKLDDYWRIREELERYFPLGFVACIEGYFRMVYANLIDFGSPYYDNASKFTEIRFGIDTALSLQKHSVSLGEFVAHLLPHNNLDDIEKNMTTLIGDSFLARVKKMLADLPRQLSFFPEYEVDPVARFIVNLKALFDLRHIFAHELSPYAPQDTPSIDSCIETAVQFLWISENIVKGLLGLAAESNTFDGDEIEF